MITLRTRSIAALFATTSLMLAGCTTTGPKQTQGAIAGGAGGAVVGALVGSAVGGRDGAVAGALIGGLSGAIIGSEIGREMDERDNAMRQAALDRAAAQASSRKSVRQTWYNKETGNSGQISTIRTYEKNGQTCSAVREVYHKSGTDRSFSEEREMCSDPGGFYN